MSELTELKDEEKLYFEQASLYPYHLENQKEGHYIKTVFFLYIIYTE